MKNSTKPSLGSNNKIKELDPCKDNEELFRNTFEQAAVGLAHVGVDGNFIRINQKFCDIVGYSTEEMLTRTFQDITHPDDLDADLEYVRQVLADEIMTYSIKKRYFKKDGELVWINLTVSLLREDNGKPLYFIAVVEDIIERKQASEDLLENETKYRDLVDNSLVGVFNATRDGKLNFVNEACARIFDFKNVEQMLSKEALPRWADPKQYEQFLAEIKKNGSVANFEAERITHTGRRIHVLQSVHLQANSISGMVMDITEQKKAENALHEREAMLSTLFNAPLEIILLINLDGTVLSINKSGARHFNKNPEALIGQNIYEFMEGEVLQQRKTSSEEVLRTGKPIHFFDEREGNYFENNVYPVFDTDGENVVSIAVFSSNITERKQAEDKFKLLVDQAGDAFFVLDFEGLIIDINKQACLSLGYSRLELLKMNILQVDTEIVEKQHVTRFWNTLDAGQYITFEAVHQRKDGSTFPVEIRLGRLGLKEKKLLLALARDITDRKKKDQALKQEAEFQKLISKISAKFVDLPADKIDQAINEQFGEIGKFFKADRVTIGLLSEIGEVLETTIMWFSDQLNIEKLATDTMGATYPNLVNHIKDQEYWSFSDPDDFSHWHPEKETIEKTDIKSGLVINTNFQKSILEIFVIDVMHSNRVWTKNIIEQVKLLGNVFSNALNRKRAEQALEKQAEFKQLVSQVSSKFMGLSGVEFEHAIENSLVEIGSYFGVDAVRLYQLSSRGEILKFRLMWQSEHLAPQEEMTEIHKMIYPNLAAHYSSGKSVVFNKFLDSPQWPEMRKILKFFGTKSGVGIPLESDKSGVDVFAMDSVISECQWPKDIIEQSKTVGKVLLSAIMRREAEVEIQNGYSEIKRLKDQLQQENIYLKEEIKLQNNFDKIIGQSTSLNYVLHRLEQVAPTDSTVLIQGETGTGKELFAHALHGASGRKDRPLINVGCASLSSNLIESEFFGHEKGAFTGADRQRIGRFELANKGTIFLDEIGELSLELQAKLLRVLQEGEIERLGSSKTIKTDVRVIAATNRILEEEVTQGHFREDLYYRLTTFKLSVPPLRDRIGDIPLLVRFFVEKLGEKLGKKIKNIPKTSMKKLENYSWPGNIRELQNTIENAIVISENEILKVEIPGSSILSQKGNMKLKDIEMDHIIEVLNSTNWRLGGKGGAAELLGMKRTTLHAKMKKYGIERQT